MKFNYRKPAVAAAIVGGVLAVSGTAAFAYWTATGTGTGQASAGQTVAFKVASTPATGDALTPGGPTQSASFSFTTAML